MSFLQSDVETTVQEWDVLGANDIRVIPPNLKQFNDRNGYTVQISGDGLWQWRKIDSKLLTFNALNESLRPLGYFLSQQARGRISQCLYKAILSFKKRVCSPLLGKCDRDRIINEKIYELEVLEAEFLAVPQEVIEQLNQKRDEMEREIRELNEKIEEQSRTVYSVLVEQIELKRKFETISSLRNKGKKIQEVDERQARRKLSEIRTKGEAVLWFAETYGLIPQSLILNDQDTGETITIDFKHKGDEKNTENTNIPAGTTLQNDQLPFKQGKYESLPDDEKSKVKGLVYILNRFCISLEGYHEITQVDGGKDLPRSYLVEGCQASLDHSWDIKRSPGTAPGAELSFKELVKLQLQRHIQANNIESPEDELFKVKLSGDGAALTHNSGLVVCSFSLLDDGQAVMSSSGNHTISVVKCKEDYDTLKYSLQNVIKEVNSLSREKFLEVDGKKLKIELYLGGDYKFLLLCMGMKAAMCKHSCIWCTCSTEERNDLTKPLTFFLKLKRRIHPGWHKDPGCRSQPLFEIPLERVIFDELHMLLRITDVLERGIIYAAISWDERDDLTKSSKDEKGIHLKKLIAALRECGVSFSVWTDKQGNLDWTSLMGNEKKKLLSNLSPKFPSFLPPEICEEVTKLWKDFKELYDIFGSWKPSAKDVQEFPRKAKEWALLLSNMKGPGFAKKNPVTPYIHILVCHLPGLLEEMGSVKSFTGQGVEKKNDDMRKYFHRKSNRWDSCRQILLVEKRMEVLDHEGCARKHRTYEKKDTSYWEHGKSLVAKNTVKKFSEETSQAHLTQQLNVQSPQHLETLPLNESVGNSDSTANNVSPSYTLSDLRKLRKKDLAAIFEEKLGRPPSKKARVDSIIQDILH